MLTEDLNFFSKYAPLMVKHKDPKKGVVPFKFNNAQNILHDKLEDQLKRTGRIRAIVLKGRQQGVSTYVGARFYQKTSRKKANNTFIMTHHSDATANLFQMTKRYHDNTDERLRTPTKTNSKTDLEFDGLDSNYKVATAGSKEIGRSYTVTNFHMSEYAFYLDPEAIKAGAMQAVPDMEGTEIIIESTANGMNNDFYSICMEALQGQGEFELIFIPWFVQEEYRATPYLGFETNDYEEKLMRDYGLDIEQVYWRRKKIEAFSGTPEKKLSKFKQEYPCNPHEAFQASGDSLIDLEAIQTARKRVVKDGGALTIFGIDPAFRGDRAVIAIKSGLAIKDTIVIDTNEQPLDEMDFVNILIGLVKKYNPTKAFMDLGGGGNVVLSRLKELGYGHIFMGVDFGARAIENNVYANKRAEMWCNLRDFIHNEECSLPDRDDVQQDLMAMPDSFENNRNREQLISKTKIKDDFKLSTDIGDAYALLFAYPTENLRSTKPGIKSNVNLIKAVNIKSRKSLKL